MRDDTAFEGECAAFGSGGEDELGVGETLLESEIGSGRGGRRTENSGEERGRKGGGVGALAMEENECLFVGQTEGFDDESGWVGRGLLIVVRRVGENCHG